MRLFAMSLLVCASSAFAASNAYDVKIDWSLNNGKDVSSSRAIVKEGQPATFVRKTDSKEQYLEVIAAEAPDNRGITMNCTVGTIGENGERTITSKSKLIVNENQPAKITQGESERGVGQLSLSVVAQRKTL